jgi:hypothetical protein
MADIPAVGAGVSTAADFLKTIKQLQEDIDESLGQIVPALLKDLGSSPSVRLSFSRSDVETLNKLYRSLQACIQKLGEKHILLLSLEAETARKERAAEDTTEELLEMIGGLQSQLEEQRVVCCKRTEEVSKCHLVSAN